MNSETWFIVRFSKRLNRSAILQPVRPYANIPIFMSVWVRVVEEALQCGALRPYLPFYGRIQPVVLIHSAWCLPVPCRVVRLSLPEEFSSNHLNPTFLSGLARSLVTHRRAGNPVSIVSFSFNGTENVRPVRLFNNVKRGFKRVFKFSIFRVVQPGSIHRE